MQTGNITFNKFAKMMPSETSNNYWNIPRMMRFENIIKGHADNFFLVDERLFITLREPCQNIINVLRDFQCRLAITDSGDEIG